MIVFLLTSMFLYQTIDADDLVGTWKAEKIVYVDQQPAEVKDGKNLVWQFTKSGKCINRTHRSEANYKIEKDQVDMDGYSITIEKLTSNRLIIRENKQFFIRRIYFARVNE